MKKKHLYIGAVVLLLVGGVFGWPHLRWLQFRLEVSTHMGDAKGIGRYPTPDEILAFPERLEQSAKKFGFSDLKVAQILENRDVGGAVSFWYLRVDLQSGSHTLATERRIETKLGIPDLEYLDEQGVTIIK